ncbi:hypothetical protein GALMADRAFT_254058 [Galerina marginata CBS 339.88]|uniref:Uncharacterized protein n=1 Tax=Galerina marginata (strain CBS 339.88) TaxID=685588 RepID=A0A067SJV3_GALM3|nr:hypothetical protein GALMADRAFT_254058 [Galerina marginata CBS 339.88]
MHLLSLFTLATAILGGVSALTVPVKRSDLDSIDVLEAREPGKNIIPNRIKFSQGAKAHMDNLGLAKGSAERKQVKAYHRTIVAEEMAKKGADSAQVVHLVHMRGSLDPKLHVSAGFWDASDKRMKSTFGTPPQSGLLHHAHADHHPVDPTYLSHVHAAGKTLRRSLPYVEDLEVREPGKNNNPIKFSGAAKAHMTNLGLAKGSAERKQVKDYHRKLVAGEMAKNGATTAQVVHLAHIEGSTDPRLHVTAGFWDASDKRMKVTYGTPPNEKNGKLVHVYADHQPVDPTYLNHINAAGKKL